MLDLEKGLAEAIRHFWHVRDSQQENQGSATGQKDAGSRAAVTGGKHGDGFVGLLADVLRDAGLPTLKYFSMKKTLPCYFRPTKDWDLIVRVVV